MKKLEPTLIFITLLLLAITLWWGIGLLKERKPVTPFDREVEKYTPAYDNTGKG